VIGMFGPITDAERRGLQRRALRVLDGLLKRTDLSPIVWTVGNAGATLVGDVVTADGDRRETWAAWVRVLDARPWPERTSGGMIHLHAVAEKYDGVTVVIRADLLSDNDSSDNDSGEE